MGGKKRGGYIYVEGQFDEKVFRKSRPEIGNLFCGIGTKEKVIRKVKNSETDCKGIVDMDHDLKGDEISFTDKIVDTNNACCLFGHLVKNCNEENILIRFCKEIIGKLNLDNAEKIEAYNQLDEEKDECEEKMIEWINDPSKNSLYLEVLLYFLISLKKKFRSEPDMHARLQFTLPNGNIMYSLDEIQ